MYKTFAIINIVLASHSFLAASLLFMKKGNRRANRYLGIINIMMGILFISGYLSLDRFFMQPALLLCLVILLVYFLTPLIYLYTFRLARTETLNDGYHFIPAGVVTLYLIVRLLIGIRQPAVTVEEIFSLRYIPVDLYILLQAGLLMLALYLLIMFLIVRDYNTRLKHMYSSIEKTNLYWLQLHLGIGISGAFIFFITNLFQFFLSDQTYPLLNRIEYLGQAFSIVFLLSIVYFTFVQADTGHVDPGVQGITHRTPSPAYTRQRLGEKREQEYVDLLLRHMEENKPYLNPELTVHDLAADLGIPAARLTMVLNIHLKKNFYQFINTYRVEYASRLLRDDRMENENILTVALDSGFNSKTSFNTYFKKIRNMTPREFRMQKKQ